MASLPATTAVAASEPIGVFSGQERAARKVTCIHDGDTGWEAGVKWRLLHVDIPELASLADCTAEAELALVARDRLIELMSDGYTVVFSGNFTRRGWPAAGQHQTVGPS